MIARLLNSNKIIHKLIDNINSGVDCSVLGVQDYVKYMIAREYNGTVLFVASDETTAQNLYDVWSEYDNSVRILTRFSSADKIANNAISTLTALYNDEISVLIITPNMLVDKVAGKDSLSCSTLRLSVLQEMDMSTLTKKLSDMGYERVDVCYGENQYSVLGESVEIASDKHYRVMYDYDTIQKIIEIDSTTLETIKNVDSVSIEPINVTKSMDVNSYLIDEVPEALIVINGTKSVYDNLVEYIKQYNQLIGANESPCKIEEVLNRMEKLTKLAFQNLNNANKFFAPKALFNINSLVLSNYFDNQKVLFAEIRRLSAEGYTVVIFAGDEKEKYKKLLFTLSPNVCPSVQLVETGRINIVCKKYNGGGIFVDEKLAIYTTHSLSGCRKKVKDNIATFDAEDLPKSGDIVVHSSYGVGKCVGIEALTLTSSKRDYVIVEYAGGDRFYLPVENLNEISKYTGSDKTPKLNKLGSKDFANTKNKIKSSMRKMASDMLKIYKERESLHGVKYPADDELQQEFENSFAYTATADQVRAVADIKQDMENGKVVDRLVCGDVGYGKTEVAMRIAFKTISCGYQVALICPTTILSQQHYNTAITRFKDFGIRVCVVNRFLTSSQTKAVFDAIERGECDMVIGTHKLLSDNLIFRKLGLVILDEEQKFGVEHKDKLKKVCNNVNVITLSATPIPRTLNMALSGIRDISVIETPPKERLSTIVNVVEYSEDIIRQAIDRELDRGGQVLILYNKVQSIYAFASKIKEMYPSVNIACAHGQMPEHELEIEIGKLYDGQTTILVATTIIENGVDLPNANTLIVVDAQELGLSTLYQLKGRVGRSDRQAYAIFTYPGARMLSEDAYKRLSAISQFAGLGSGFKIALKDLEIRGAGSVLGLEQSGHMQKIGYHMYIELLNQAIGEMQGLDSAVDTKVETDLDAYIPTDYIQKDYLRVRMYNKISKLKSDAEYEELYRNMSDVFGNVPDSVVNIMRIGLIKNIAGGLHIIKVVYKKTNKCLELNDVKNIDVGKLTSNCVSLNMQSNIKIELGNAVDSLEKLQNFLIDIKNH